MKVSQHWRLIAHDAKLGLMKACLSCVILIFLGLRLEVESNYYSLEIH